MVALLGRNEITVIQYFVILQTAMHDELLNSKIFKDETLMIKVGPFILISLTACTTLPIQNQDQLFTQTVCDPTSQKPNTNVVPARCSKLEFQHANYSHHVKSNKLHRYKNKNLYLGAGVAALNNPQNPSGDVDNIAISVGGKLAFKNYSFRPEVQLGERSNSFNTSVSHDFRILGNGPGAIDGNFGLGYSINTGEENNVLGNANSAFFRIGAEGQLAGDIMTGIALMLAPWGYNGDDTAIAGMGYFGFRF